MDVGPIVGPVVPGVLDVPVLVAGLGVGAVGEADREGAQPVVGPPATLASQVVEGAGQPL